MLLREFASMYVALNDSAKRANMQNDSTDSVWLTRICSSRRGNGLRTASFNIRTGIATGQKSPYEVRASYCYSCTLLYVLREKNGQNLQ